METGWCNLISNLLATVSDLDSKEKVLQAMETILVPCRNDFKQSVDMLVNLRTYFMELLKEEQRSEDNEDDFFIEMIHSIEYLIAELNQSMEKEEL